MKKIAILFTALALLAVTMLSGCAQTQKLNSNQLDFAGVTLNFRSNLSEAAKVPLYPSDIAIRDLLINSNVQRIGIAFIPNDSENSYYAVDSFEIAYKLTVLNKYYFNTTKVIDSLPVNSTFEAVLDASSSEPVIMLLGPSHANSTSVYMSGNLIAVQGSSLGEVNTNYTDLDLSTDRMLLSLFVESM